MPIWKRPMVKLKELEDKHKGTSIALEEFINSLNFDEQGLIPVIAQDFDTKEVLMLAWMDQQSILNTLSEEQVCYFSRSRQSYWRKGEESGHTQLMKKMSIDCDGDSILLLVEQQGPACHTNRQSCFYFEVSDQIVSINSDPIE